MAILATAPRDMRSVLFDRQPTPVLLLSDDLVILLANEASHNMFNSTILILNTHIAELPIRWPGHTDQALQDLLAGVATEVHEHDEADTRSKIKIQILEQSNAPPRTACLFTTKILLENQSYRILSFENIEDTSDEDVTAPSSNPLASPRLELSEVEHRTSYSGIVEPTEAKRHVYGRRLSELCNAVYHSDERSGFILSADETFCFPNYRGSADVEPVEIDDMDAFCKEWDLWDPHFQHKLSSSEYPSIWLNKTRKKFHKRYGMKENGKNLVFEADGQPLHHPQTGEYLGGVVWMKQLGEYDDIVAAELKSTYVDFKNICDRLPHIIYTADLNGHVDYFSQKWYDFTGLTEAESLGLEFSNAIHPDDFWSVHTEFQGAGKLKVELNRELRYRRHDGQWLWMNVRARPLLDSNGSILRWYGTSTEVNTLVVERQEAEKKKAQIVQMLSLAHIGLFEITFEGQLNVLEGQLGWFNGHSSSLFVHSIDGSPCNGMTTLVRHCHEIISGDAAGLEFEIQMNLRWYKFRLMRDSDINDNKILGCSVDITEQKERADLEAENARLSHEATLETEKSRLKSAFLAHMTHEIRTPIAGVIGLADMLAESQLDQEQRDCVSNILVSGHNLLRIVNDILDMSKVEAGQMRFEMIPFDIYEVLVQVRNLFLPTARGKHLELLCRKESATDSGAVGDPGRVRQILTNLVSNAIKFTDNGSIELFVEKKGPNFKIVVADTGCGIDAETMGLLFKPFVQGDTSMARRYGGTGLGLSISRNLAHGMSGTLILDSVPRKGTRAILTIPRGRESKEVPVKERSFSFDASSMPRPLPVRSRESTPSNIIMTQSTPKTTPEEKLCGRPLILVVEDNAINQKVALNLVRKLGYNAHAVWNGQEALDFLESGISSLSQNITLRSDQSLFSNTTIPSLILMDCQMPLLDGYGATQKLRTEVKYALVKTVPVIALTASAIHGDPEKCVAAGMDDYLSKPVTKLLLQQMIKKWLLKAGVPGKG